MLRLRLRRSLLPRTHQSASSPPGRPFHPAHQSRAGESSVICRNQAAQLSRPDALLPPRRGGAVRCRDLPGARLDVRRRAGPAGGLHDRSGRRPVPSPPRGKAAPRITSPAPRAGDGLVRPVTEARVRPVIASRQRCRVTSVFPPAGLCRHRPPRIRGAPAAVGAGRRGPTSSSARRRRRPRRRHVGPGREERAVTIVALAYAGSSGDASAPGVGHGPPSPGCGVPSGSPGAAPR